MTKKYEASITYFWMGPPPWALRARKISEITTRPLLTIQDARPITQLFLHIKPVTRLYNLILADVFHYLPNFSRKRNRYGGSISEIAIVDIHLC